MIVLENQLSRTITLSLWERGEVRKMGLSFSHIVIVLLIILVLFGAGKLPKVMGDLGKGLRNFKDGLKGEGDDDTNAKLPPSDKPKGE